MFVHKERKKKYFRCSFELMLMRVHIVNAKVCGKLPEDFPGISANQKMSDTRFDYPLRIDFLTGK